MRIVVLILTLAFASFASVTIAEAQAPAQPTAPVVVQPKPGQVQITKAGPRDRDRVQSHDMGMVGSFIGISAVYMMLYAHFISVIQMLVYAGAIMVLFVFVIMILNRPEDEPVAPSGRIGQVIGGAAIVYLVGRLCMLLIHVKLPNEAIAKAAPAAYSL